MLGNLLAAGVCLCGSTDPDASHPRDLFDAASFAPTESPAASSTFLALDPALVAALAPIPVPELDRGAHFELGGFFQDIQLGTIRQDDIRAQFGIKNSSKVGETNHENVDRWRAGVQLAWGIEAIRLEARAFYEAFDMGHDFDLFGGSLALEGQPELGRWDNVAFLVDYRAALTYARGDGEVPFLDRSSGQTFDVDGTMDYWEAEYRLGLGIEIADFQLTAGGVGDVISGLINLDLDDDMEFEGGNYGGYVRAAWRPDDLPLYVGAIGFAGDIEGFAVELGFRL